MCVESQEEMKLSAQTHVERGQSSLIDLFRICLKFGFNQIVNGFLPWFIKKKKKKKKGQSLAIKVVVALGYNLI